MKSGLRSHALHSVSPVEESRRHVVLDALRGFALMGVCLANFPEFSLYSFLSAEQRAAMPTAGADTVVRWLQLVFVDGKFYTLFSLLFGIGFSIILSNAQKYGSDGMRIFFRRMIILFIIGLAHLMFVWSGDILLLYALLGLLLPAVSRWRDKWLIGGAVVMFAMPIVVDAVAEMRDITVGGTLLQIQWHYCDKYGITQTNFSTWLRDAQSYGDVSAFLVQGAFERLWEFVEGNRYFKVMGLFLCGFYIGRKQLYTDIEKHKKTYLHLIKYGLLIGVPVSLIYAWSNVNGRPLGNAMHTLAYTLSVYPMGFAYAAILIWTYHKKEHLWLWQALAAAGRMALTCYLCQSLMGMFLFYGIGLGGGTHFGLAETECIAMGVFLLESIVCLLWLHYFRYGPFEWIWRMLTYGKRLPIKHKITIKDKT